VSSTATAIDLVPAHARPTTCSLAFASHAHQLGGTWRQNNLVEPTPMDGPGNGFHRRVLLESEDGERCGGEGVFHPTVLDRVPPVTLLRCDPSRGSSRCSRPPVCPGPTFQYLAQMADRERTRRGGMAALTGALGQCLPTCTCEAPCCRHWSWPVTSRALPRGVPTSARTHRGRLVSGKETICVT